MSAPLPDYSKLLADLYALLDAERIALSDRVTIGAAWRAISRMQNDIDAQRLAQSARLAKGASE